MSVPSNLIPITILGLPEDPSPSETGWMMYVNNGNTYKVQVNALLNISGVPTTRQINTGTGLQGGGDLSQNRTISIAPEGVSYAELDKTGVTAGVYGDASNYPVFTVDDTGRVTAATELPIPSITGFVPTSRQVIAGVGLSGGGALTTNVTLNANLSDALPLSVGTTSAGTSDDMSRADHVHPAIDLTDTTQTDGVLDPTRGGTGTALTAPAAGGIVYSDGSALQVSTVGSPGQVLASTGAGAPAWATVEVVSPVPANTVRAGPTSGPDADPTYRALVNADLPNSGVSANTYGSQSIVPVFAVNAKGVLTGVTNTTIGNLANSALQNSSITINGNSVSLGGSTTVTASTTASATFNNSGSGDASPVTFNGSTAVTISRNTLGAAASGTNADITSMTALSAGISSPTYVQFGNGSAVTLAAGKLWYDNTTGTLNFGMGGGNITQQVGEELFVYGKASATIADSPLQIVYKTGTVGASSVITFGPTVAGITDGGKIIGVATEDITSGNFGRITAFGIVHGINTTGADYGETWADNDDIWYNPVTGNPTKTKPSAPNIKVQVGTVINAGPGGSGSFQVLLNTGSVLGGTDSNVQITSAADQQLLQYYGAGAYWRNVNPSAVTGVGSLANALTIGTGLSGTSYNGSSAVTIAISNTGVTADTYGSASSVPVFAVNAQGQITSVTNTAIAIAYTAVSGLGTAATLNAGVAGGVATLDGGGTVPTSQLPAAVLGAVKYQGTWDASTNTPTLTSSVGTQGYYYVVDVAGSTNLNGITDWKVGDWAIFNGSVWQKIDNTDAVTSVNGYTGTVVLSYSDVGAPSTSGTGATGTWGISISGNAATATSATSATSATTATNATNVAVTADATNTSRYLAFTSATTGNVGVLVDSDLTYNPSTNILTVGTLTATTGISGGTF